LLLQITSSLHSEAVSSSRVFDAWNLFAKSRWGNLRYLVEIGLILMWALYVGRAMLDRDPNVLNIGGDNVSAYGRFFWDHVESCGTCALWSGDVRGGNPAFIDPNADTFHPAVAVPALLVGTLQSFKLTIVICLFMGGLHAGGSRSNSGHPPLHEWHRDSWAPQGDISPRVPTRVWWSPYLPGRCCLYPGGPLSIAPKTNS
jgi:hypothetical protein